MTLATRPLRIRLQTPAGAALAGAKVTLQLSAYQVDGTDIVPLAWDAIEDPAKVGDYVLDVWPNTRGDGGTHYDTLVQANGQVLLRQVITVTAGPSEALVAAKINAAPWPPLYEASSEVQAARLFSEAAGESAGKAMAGAAVILPLAEQFGDVGAIVGDVTAKRNQAEGFATTTQTLASTVAAQTLVVTQQSAAAAAARDMALVQAGVAVDEPTGRAGAADGQAFKVQGDGWDTAAIEFRRTNSGASTRLADYPTAAKVKWSLAAFAGALASTRNLYVHSRRTVGQYVNTAGGLSADAAYSVSALIPCDPSTTYTLTVAAGQLAQFDRDGTYIAGTYAANVATVTTGPSTRYLRFSSTNTTIGPTVLVQGSTAPALYIAAAAEDAATARRGRMADAYALAEAMLPAVRNLFDQARATDDTALNSIGVTYAFSGWFVTPLIPTAPSTTYVSNKGSGGGGGSFYDENGAFISSFSVGNGQAFTTPANGFFFRQQVNGLSSKTSMMLVKGSTLPSSYVSFSPESSATTALNAMLAARAVTDAALPAGRNRFDQLRALDNTAVSNVNGATYAATNYFATPLIAVTPGGNLFVSVAGITGIYFDQNGTYLPGSGFNGLTAQPATVPAGAYFVRFQVFNLTNKASLMVTNQATASGYLPFGGGGASYPNQGKRIGFVGNSQTANLLYQAAVIANTGMVQSFINGNPGKDITYIADTVISTLDLSNTDVVFLHEGANDWGGGSKLGRITDAVGAAGVYGKLKKAIEGLYALKPSIQIVIGGVPYRGATTISNTTYPADSQVRNGSASDPTDPDVGGKFTGKDCDDAYRAVAELYGLPFVELRKRSGLNALNVDQWTGDQLHWNAAMAARVGRLIAGTCNSSL